MHKSIVHIGLLALAMMSVSACKNANTPAGTLVIQPKSLEMEIGDMQQLSLTWNEQVLDANVAKWSSSDQTVAFVSGGIVQAQQSGGAVIKATYQAVTAECFVIVNGEPEQPKEDLSGAIKYLPKSKKRGVGYSFASFPQEDVAALAPYISWCYNWGSQPSSATISDMLDEYKIDYIPMAWNGVNDEQIRAYKQSHPQCEYILAFNEPNLTDQANMTPQQAAQKWPALKALAQELGLKIVSPAMNYGTLAGYSDPVKWLDEFFQLIPKSDVCAIALHCYMGSASAMYSFLHRFDKYELPVWMTEFCSWDSPAPGSMEAQIDYMNEAVVMLEAEPMVERYAWFIPRASGKVDSYPYMQLLSKDDIGALSPQGEVYAGLTSFDKTVWLSSAAPILANTYSNSSAAETIRNGNFEPAPHLRPATEDSGVLMITSLISGNWVEYQIDAASDIQYLRIRYQGVVGSPLTICVDGNEAAQVQLQWNQSKWAAQEVPLTMTKGKHTLRLVSGGNVNFSWLKLQ